MMRLLPSSFLAVLTVLTLGGGRASAATATAQEAAPARRAFALPAGEATETLPLYIRQSGQALVYPEHDVRGVRTQEVRGEFPVAEALERMIAGTPLALVTTPGRSAWAVVRRPSPHPAPRAAPAPAAPPPPAPPAADATINLSALVVTAAPAAGYRAATSYTATGIGTPVFATPIPISVIGRRFLVDTGSHELRDALSYVAGVSTNPRRESMFLIRGYSGLISYRNGQYRRQLFSTWNLDRIEVIKGPPALFFGNVRPGGVINTFTTQPQLGARFTEVELTLGADDYVKAAAYTNVPLGDTLAMRAGLGALHSTDELDQRVKDETYAGAAAVWQPCPRHRLALDLETIDRDTAEARFSVFGLGNARFHGAADAPLSPQAAGLAPAAAMSAATQIREYLAARGFSADPAAANFAPTLDTFVPLFGAAATVRGQDRTFVLSPDSYRDFLSRTVDLDYLFQAHPQLVWQTQLNFATDDARGLRPGDELIPYADGSLLLRFEQFINLRDSYNADNRLVGRFDLGASRHTLQLGQEWQRVVFRAAGFIDATGAFQQSAFSPWSYWRPGLDPLPRAAAAMAGSEERLNGYRRRTEEQEGYFVALQSAFLDERLRLLGGARYNRIRQRATFTAPATDSEPAAATSGVTHQLGLLAAVWPGVHLFGVSSTGLEPALLVDAAGRTAEPIASRGHDVGVKTALQDGRLSSTLTYYSLERTHVPRVEAGQIFYDGDTHVAEGVELELNYAPNDHYQLLLGWNHFLRAEIDASREPGHVGQPLPYSPAHTLSGWQRVTAPLPGGRRLSLGTGFRYAAAARLASSPLHRVESPSFLTWDASVGFALPWAGREVLAQLHLRNLTDEPYREGSDGAFGHGRSWSLRLATRF